MGVGKEKRLDLMRHQCSPDSGELPRSQASPFPLFALSCSHIPDRLSHVCGETRAIGGGVAAVAAPCPFCCRRRYTRGGAAPFRRPCVLSPARGRAQSGGWVAAGAETAMSFVNMMCAERQE